MSPVSEPSKSPKWRWHAESKPGGDAVVVDIDGVLSDATKRQHFLEAGKKDWRGFFDACAEDAPIVEMRALIDLLDSELRIVLLTGRPVRVEEQTVDWLDRHSIRWDLLIMREAGDYGASREFKEKTIARLRDEGFNLLLAFEDDRRNQEIFRNQGVPCVYIHSGYYE